MSKVIVFIEDDVFKNGCSDLSDLLIFLLGPGRRQAKIRVVPAYRPNGRNAVNGWLDDRDLQLRQVLVSVFERGIRATEYSVFGANDGKIIISNSPSKKSAGLPQFHLKDALEIYSKPAEVLVENARIDWSFISKIVPTEWFNIWNEAVTGGWIVPRHGGGITEIKEIIELDLSKNEARRRRSIVLVDSDSRKPGRPSVQSNDVEKACKNQQISFIRLSRRAIENYISKVALYSWANSIGKPKKRKKVRLSVDKFFTMTSEQRYHFNMKTGFDGDRKSASGIDAIYDGVDEKHLVSGFSKKLAIEVWNSGAHEPMEEQSFSSFTDERHAIFQMIFTAI